MLRQKIRPDFLDQNDARSAGKTKGYLGKMKAA
jgi:hypothetical protein